MTTEEARRDFVSTRCRCGKAKTRYQSFCKRCYYRLPRPMRTALYHRFGQAGGSYEQAYREAVVWLSQRRCRICGCTDDDCRQCIEKTGKACHWVEPDLCSACAPEIRQ